MILARSNPLLDAMREEIDLTLHKLAVWTQDPYTPDLSAMIKHHFGWNSPDGTAGKRLRPLLTLLSCHASGGNWKSALPAAAAVETIHNFSLVHDDIQDRSSTRRGRPTVWSLWGEAQAINAGDTIFVLAHMFIHKMAGGPVPPDRILTVSSILDQACLELTFGQHLDLAFEAQSDVTVEQYNRMIHGKTASLLAAACEIGGVIAGADPDHARHFHDFGIHLGKAFQIQDDILGIWGSDEQTGKPSGDDILSRKKTMPILLGLQESPIFLSCWQKEAISPEDLPEMLNALNRNNIYERTLQESEKHTRRALESLKLACTNMEGFQLLSTLAQSLLNRNS